MKKLMMAVAIVCAAVGVQAASISWMSNNKSLTTLAGVAITDASSADFAKIVLVNLGSTADFSDVKTSQIIATGSGTGYTTMALNTATGAKGGRISGKATFTYTGSGTDLINNGDYLALMIQDGDTLTQLTYTSGTDKDSAVAATYQVSGLASDASALTSAAIGMTGNFAVAVPEPTSGLLLLLGMAGLALKRKIA